MSTFTYKFEELELMKCYHVVADGECDVTYRKTPAEPDVGFPLAYPRDIEITSIVVYPTIKGIGPLNLDQDHWLYKAIYNQLIKSNDLYYACQKDCNNG